jgi:hypothetical protein
LLAAKLEDRILKREDRPASGVLLDVRQRMYPAAKVLELSRTFPPRLATLSCWCALSAAENGVAVRVPG